MSAASYSIHSQLPCILKAVLQQPEVAPCRDDRDPTYRGKNLHRGDKIFPSNTVARNGHYETEILSVISKMLVFSNFVICRFVIKVSRHRYITHKFNEVYSYLS